MVAAALESFSWLLRCWEPGRRGESANRKSLTEADDRIDALYKSPADAGIPTLDAVRR